MNQHYNGQGRAIGETGHKHGHLVDYSPIRRRERFGMDLTSTRPGTYINRMTCTIKSLNHLISAVSLFGWQQSGGSVESSGSSGQYRDLARHMAVPVHAICAP
jgi:hypothetical protein